MASKTRLFWTGNIESLLRLIELLGEGVDKPRILRLMLATVRLNKVERLFLDPLYFFAVLLRGLIEFYKLFG
jgi:hypothetical protein